MTSSTIHDEGFEPSPSLTAGPVEPGSAASQNVHLSAERERMSPANLRLLILLLCSTFVVILNETTMGVALPPIMVDFQITPAAGQWLTTAFLLTMAVVIPTTGWLLGRLGTRRAYLVAMTSFTIGTALAAFAPTFSVLLGRAWCRRSERRS